MAGRFKIKAVADSVTTENSLPASFTTVFSLCPHVAEGERVLSEVSLIRL